MNIFHESDLKENIRFGESLDYFVFLFGLHLRKYIYYIQIKYLQNISYIVGIHSWFFRV